MPSTSTPRKSKRDLQSRAMADALNLLGHPGFRTLLYGLEEEPPPDPGVVLVAILSCEDLDESIVEAVPWLILRFEHLDWDWIVREAVSRSIQNRLGFMVNLAAQVAAEGAAEQERLVFLTRLEERLFEYRIDREEALCCRRLPNDRKQRLRELRSSEARQWGILSALRPADLDCPGF